MKHDMLMQYLVKGFYHFVLQGNDLSDETTGTCISFSRNILNSRLTYTSRPTIDDPILDMRVLCRCDECMLCYHFGCLDPPMKKTPKQRGYSWHCEACDPSNSSVSYQSANHFVSQLHGS